MTDGEMLLSAILSDPADDLPRLQYADWLEETGGEAERGWAEFIRVQVEIAGYAKSKHGVIVCEGKGPPARAGFRKRCKCRPCHLVRHDRELLFRWGTKVIPEGVNVIMSPMWHQFARTDAGVEFSRGFVRRAFFPLAAWQQHGPALVAAHPVEVCEMAPCDVRLVQSYTFGRRQFTVSFGGLLTFSMSGRIGDMEAWDQTLHVEDPHSSARRLCEDIVRAACIAMAGDGPHWRLPPEYSWAPIAPAANAAALAWAHAEAESRRAVRSA